MLEMGLLDSSHAQNTKPLRVVIFIFHMLIVAMMMMTKEGRVILFWVTEMHLIGMAINVFGKFTKFDYQLPRI